MDAKLKASWLAVTGILLGLVLLIDLVEISFPPGRLTMDLMLGIVLLGFGAIFAWAYGRRVRPGLPKQPDWPDSIDVDGSRKLTMKKQIRPAIFLFLLLTLLTGGLYPLAVTAVAQVAFPAQANGSLLEQEGVVIGSALVGQANGDPRYFWPRPSATNYSALPSGGSNLGATSAPWQQQVQERATALRQAHGLAATSPLPADLLLASASGLDPHISPAAAALQVERVAAARGLTGQQVAELVAAFTEPPQWGFLGEARVNVLLLNLALDGVQ